MIVAQRSERHFAPSNRKSLAYPSSSHTFTTQREEDPESALMHYRARSYDPRTGRFLQNDPDRFRDSYNLYEYAGQDPQNWSDPTGRGKAKVVGWIVRRVGVKVFKVARVLTHKRAAKMFLKDRDVLLREGFDSAKKVADLCIPKSNQLMHRGGHVLRGGLQGLSHIQERVRTGPARHIFYLTCALIAAGATAEASSDSGSKPYSVDLTEVYSDPYPGSSIANALTVTYWTGEDSLLSWLDWVNPLEFVALGGDAGRWLDRELNKELLGYVVTLVKNGDPKYSITLGSDGELISFSEWTGEETMDVMSGGQLDQPLKGAKGKEVVDFLEDFISGVTKR